MLEYSAVMLAVMLVSCSCHARVMLDSHYLEKFAIFRKKRSSPGPGLKKIRIFIKIGVRGDPSARKWFFALSWKGEKPFSRKSVSPRTRIFVKMVFSLVLVRRKAIFIEFRESNRLCRRLHRRRQRRLHLHFFQFLFNKSDYCTQYFF